MALPQALVLRSPCVALTGHAEPTRAPLRSGSCLRFPSAAGKAFPVMSTLAGRACVRAVYPQGPRETLAAPHSPTPPPA